MVAKRKSVMKRKRGAGATPGPKKKQTVAEKKKHVRELAKKARWGEIERLYGQKILAKAKTYAEQHRKTPTEIAHDILVKNGYLPSGPAATTTARDPVVNRRVESSSRVNEPRIQVAIPTRSPEVLTKEQQELIEQRRREALERRRRVQQSGMSHAQAPVVIQPDPVEDTRPPIAPVQARHHQQLHPPDSTSRIQSGRLEVQPQVHRIVTPENLPTANAVVELEPVRPECFWDDLEAAAEIVQWENEHMAEVALVPPPAKNCRRELEEHGTVKARDSVVSISQELAAAAEVIQWENENEVSPEGPALNQQGSDSDAELDAPQFQLLPVHVTDDFEQLEQNAIETVSTRPRRATSRQSLPSNKLQSESKSHRKRPLIAAPPPALPRSSANSSKVTNPGGDNQRHSTSSHSGPDPTTKFIDKHLLEDKLELPVLEFLDMMLA